MPEENFNTVLYTGDGVSQSAGGNAITGVGFAPDFVWIKSRTTLEPHALSDVVQGTGVYLQSNLSDAQYANVEAIMSFDSDGWTMGDQSRFNQSTKTYVAWNW